MDAKIETVEPRVREVLAWAFKDVEGDVRSSLHDKADLLLRDCLLGALDSDAGVAFDRFRDRGFLLFDTADDRCNLRVFVRSRRATGRSIHRI